jgi:hypothetical protein
MPDRPPLPTYDWRIRLKDDQALAPPVRAAYHDDDSDFVRFKDGHHKTVYMIATDRVLDIGRLDPNSEYERPAPH